MTEHEEKLCEILGAKPSAACLAEILKVRTWWDQVRGAPEEFRSVDDPAYASPPVALTPSNLRREAFKTIADLTARIIGDLQEVEAALQHLEPRDRAMGAGLDVCEDLIRGLHKGASEGWSSTRVKRGKPLGQKRQFEQAVTYLTCVFVRELRQRRPHLTEPEWRKSLKHGDKGPLVRFLALGLGERARETWTKALAAAKRTLTEAEEHHRCTGQHRLCTLELPAGGGFFSCRCEPLACASSPAPACASVHELREELKELVPLAVKRRVTTEYASECERVEAEWAQLSDVERGARGGVQYPDIQPRPLGPDARPKPTRS